MTARKISLMCWTTAIVAAASAAHAQPAQPSGRFAVSATLGVLRPLDASVTGVYGRRLMPFTAQLDVRLAPDLSVFGAVKRVSADGHTVIVGTPVADESYPTALRMTSVRLGAQVSKWIAPRWALAAGAGVSITSYEETWPAAGLAVNDRATGFTALAEGRYAFRARWNVIARLEYEAIPESTTLGTTRVNLGGLDASGGVRFIF